MKDGEHLLGAGLVCVAVAAGISPLPMIGLIGFVLFLVAAGLLIFGGLKARTLEAPPFRSGSGMVLLIAGVGILIVMAFCASTWAWGQAGRMIAEPTSQNWGILSVFSLAPPLFIALGLWFLTDWPASRCALWGVAALGVTPATIQLFHVCSTFLPLSL